MAQGLSMAKIHPTALVDPSAELGEDVTIGPYAIVGPHVKIDEGTRIDAYTQVEGHTTLGKNNHFYGHSHIGCDPQDKKYAREPTQLIVGDNNTVFQYVTLSTGTIQDQGITRIGDDNWIMAYVHIAHDCLVGNHTILANNATLAGHVTLGDYVILGGFTGVHQFVTIGDYAFTSISSVVKQDIPAYVTAAGQPVKPYGLNSEGLKRHGFSREEIAQIKRAYKLIYRSGKKLSEALTEIQSWQEPKLQAFIKSIQNSTRGIIR